jgi:hypothetical protein
MTCSLLMAGDLFIAWDLIAAHIMTKNIEV